MKTKVLVAGGTGNLGGRIINALLKRGADVVAVVRHSSDSDKVSKLEVPGVHVIEVDMLNVEELIKACTGVSCVVSALAGLEDVIVDAQGALLKAAVAAGVAKFIPSDYSCDFTELPKGENRNFDLRLAFHQQLNAVPIAATSIFNGAFADILSYNTPVYDLKKHSVGYWGDNADWKLDFTTMDNTADYTAAAALDAAAPRYLHISGFKVSPNDLVTMGSELKKTDFKLVHMGSLEEFAAYVKHERAAHPEGEKELYPKWQSSQYMLSMFRIQNTITDNDRYPNVQWTGVKEVLAEI